MLGSTSSTGALARAFRLTGDDIAVDLGCGTGQLTLPVGQALHWMRYEELIPGLRPLLRSGGGIAVIANGTPLWQQASPWSQALRGVLEEWLGITTTRTCGTDDASQRRYREVMAAAGYAVTEDRYEYAGTLDLDQLVGGVYSALGVQQLPGADQRAAFAERVERAVAPYAPFTEAVAVRMLFGRLR